MASQRDADLIAELEESRVVLQKNLQRLGAVKIPKNPQPRMVVVSQNDVWKLKCGFSVGIFLAGISIGVLIVTLSRSRHEEMWVVPVLAEQVVVPKPSLVVELVEHDEPIKVRVTKPDPIVVSSVPYLEPARATPEAPARRAVIPKKDVLPASSSSGSLLQRIHKLREQIKKGK